MDEKKAAIYRQAGINRISFGLQSTNNNELRMLGRIHTYEQFLESLRIAEEAGFDNINIDFMSALPGQSIESFKSVNASGQSGVFEQNKRNNSESRKYSKLHTKKFAVSNLSEYGYCVF